MTTSQMSTQKLQGRIPSHLVIGILLIALAWPLAWFGPEPFSAYTFFPLWLGYILAVDGLTLVRSGSSLLARSGRRFALLFAFSIPLWWLFEFANRYLENWQYHAAISYEAITYVLLASISFSTVMPALFVTARLYCTFGVFAQRRTWIKIAPSRSGLVVVAVLGLVLFIGSLIFPRIMFPFVWIGLFLFIDVINAFTGGRSITSQVTKERWDTVLVLFAAGITCGFFWELWNFWSLPKWTYTIPMVSRPKIFEMPLLGYGGYLPFSLEVYATYHLLHSLLFRSADTFLNIDKRPSADDPPCAL